MAGDRTGMAGIGEHRIGLAGAVCTGRQGHGSGRQASHRQGLAGVARSAPHGTGKAGRASTGLESKGNARRGRTGSHWHASDWRGMQRQDRFAQDRIALAGIGRTGKDWLAQERGGRASMGRTGTACTGWHRIARDRSGRIGQQRSGRASIGAAWQAAAGADGRSASVSTGEAWPAGFNSKTNKRENSVTQYQWRKDGPTPKVDAQVFGEMVEKIAGSITNAKPDDIVDAARPASSPIHAAFVWDNDKCGDLYRRQQARQFIGALQIVRVEVREGQATSNRAFFSVQIADRKGYVGQNRIFDDTDLKLQVLNTAHKELESYIRKFGGIVALSGYVKRLEAILDEMRDDADTLLAEASKRRKPKSHDETQAAAATVA